MKKKKEETTAGCQWFVFFLLLSFGKTVAHTLIYFFWFYFRFWVVCVCINVYLSVWYGFLSAQAIDRPIFHLFHFMCFIIILFDPIGKRTDKSRAILFYVYMFSFTPSIARSHVHSRLTIWCKRQVEPNSKLDTFELIKYRYSMDFIGSDWAQSTLEINKMESKNNNWCGGAYMVRAHNFE